MAGWDGCRSGAAPRKRELPSKAGPRKGAGREWDISVHREAHCGNTFPQKANCSASRIIPESVRDTMRFALGIFRASLLEKSQKCLSDVQPVQICSGIRPATAQNFQLPTERGRSSFRMVLANTDISFVFRLLHTLQPSNCATDSAHHGCSVASNTMKLRSKWPIARIALAGATPTRTRSIAKRLPQHQTIPPRHDCNGAHMCVISLAVRYCAASRYMFRT